MAKKLWCIPSFHPLVREVSDKYHISRDDAKSILNTARRKNPALNYDEMTLSFLEGTDEFKEEIGKYRDKYIDIDNILNPLDKAERKARWEEINDAFSRNISEDEADYIIGLKSEVENTIKTSKLSADNIAKTFSVFKDPRRMDFIGHYIIRRASDIVTQLQTDEKYRISKNIKRHNNRGEYYDDPDVRTEIKNQTFSDFRQCIEWLKEDGNDILASELQGAIDNYYSLLYMYGGELYRDEGINVDPDGIMMSSNAPSTSEDRNDSDNNDAEEDQDDVENEEKPVGDFSVSDQNKSVYSKIVPDIKIMLANCLDKDSEGNPIQDDFGYYLPTYISVSSAMNRLHVICEGCKSSTEVIARLKEAQEAQPWISSIITALDTNVSEGVNEGIIASSSRKEQLQTMFFQSVVKPFTNFKQTYRQYIDGEVMFVTSDGNVKNRYDELTYGVIQKFHRMAGADIFLNGFIDPDNIAMVSRKISAPPGRIDPNDPSIEGMIMRANSEVDAANDITVANPDFSNAYKMINDIKKELVKSARSLGVNFKKQDIDIYVNEAKYDAAPSKRQSTVNKLKARLQKMSELRTRMEYVANALTSWVNADESFAGINPFTQKRATNSSVYEFAKNVKGTYRGLITEVSDLIPSEQESSAHMGGKDYYSRNNPSSVGTIIDNLKDSNIDNVQDYIKEKYGQDTLWYIKDTSETGEKSTPENPHFYSDWLEDIYYGNGSKVIAYAEKPLINGKSYNEVSDLEYSLSLLNDYFGTTGSDSNYAWYRTLIASDKPRYSIIRGKKYNLRTNDNDDFRNVVAKKATDFFAQEIKRSESVARFAAFGSGTKVLGYDLNLDNANQKAVIEKMREGKKVSIKDVVKDGKYIFTGTGASFFMNKFINNEIEKGTDLGKAVVNKIFNSHLNKKATKLLSPTDINNFKNAFHENMSSIIDNDYDYFKNIGLFQKKVINVEGSQVVHAKYLYGNLIQWHSNEENYFSRLYSDSLDEARELASQYETPEDIENSGVLWYYCELVNFKKDLEEFAYNNWLAKANTSQIIDVDLAFYGNTTNFQKRNAQMVSAGYIADPDARIHGNLVSDGKYRSVTIMTPRVDKSATINNINEVFNRAIEKEPNENKKEKLKEAKEKNIKNLTNFDATDGQAYTSLTGLRKRLIGQGNWSRSDTEELDEKGRDDKGRFIFTDEAVYRRLMRRNPAEIQTGDLLHVFGQPQKPFVFAATNMYREGRENITVPVQHKNSEYMLPFLLAPEGSQMAAISQFLEESAEDDAIRGIDTANFDSGVKIGNNSDMIDITGLSAEDTLKKLRASVYEVDDEGNYKRDADNKKIKRQDAAGVVTEYDIQDYKIVQQKPEHFKGNAQPLGTQMKILAINNINDEAECELPGGTKISGKDLKRRYFNALAEKTEKEERKFRESLGLYMPHASRVHRLSNTLKRAMSTDQKFDSEMRKALSITTRDGIEQFLSPLDDPSVQGAVEAMLLSKIRRAYYKEKTNGGVVVQATSWGISDDLNIRFYSSNPADKDGLIPIGADENYIKKYQKGFAYFECEMPMPNYVKDILMQQKGGIRQFLNDDGTWKMDEIKNVVPASAFDCISYRIPTEAKYSIMVGKIVRFAPECSGSVGKFPKELTIFTGSDFDIDTDFVELRPIPGSKDYAVDNLIFDLQVAALRSDSALLETFRPGDFSDLQDMSYYVTCLLNGMTAEELSKMTPKQIKDACNRFEDMDLMDIKTDVLLRKQNADAGNMIGIAAVGVTSHAFISLYNDSHSTDPKNCIRINIKESKPNTVTENFTVINDKNGPDNTTKMNIEGSIILDPTHDMDGNLIGTEISKYVGASADAAKDAALYRLNITEETLPILIYMHRMGISGDVARMFISQPIIRQVMTKMNSGSAFDSCSFDTAANELLDELEEEEKKTNPNFDINKEYADIVRGNDLKLVYSDLVKSIENPESQSIGDKIKLLHIYDILNDLKKSISNLDSFVRYNSANAMKGSSYLERLVQRQKVRRLEENLNDENARISLPENIDYTEDAPGGEYGKLFSMFPYIGRTVAGEEEMDKQIFQEEMHTYGIGFMRAAEQLGLLTGNNPSQDVKKLRSLYNGWKAYNLFVGANRVVDFLDEDTARKYTRGFDVIYENTIKKIEEEKPELYNEVIKGNSFISSIYPIHAKEGYGDFSMLAANVAGIKGNALEKYKKDWEVLLDYPETRQLAIDTSIHFLTRSAGYAHDTPVAIMPLAIRQAIPNYFRAFTDADKYSMSDEDFKHFISLFLRNNSEKDKGFVPHLYKSDKVDKYHFNEDGTVLFINRKHMPVKLGDSIERVGDKYVANIPIVNVNEEYLVEIDEIEPVKIGKDNFFACTINFTTPLGIPNQMSEYGGQFVYEGAGTIMTDDEDTPPSSDDTAEENSETPEKYEPMSSILRERAQVYTEDRRAGSVFLSEPFGDDVHDDNVNIMSTDAKDLHNGFLETRQHLKRAGRIASLFGFKVQNTQRGVSDGKPTYFLNLVPEKNGMEQHESAIKTAAIISSLGFRTGVETTVKTYVSDARDANGIELSIPIKDYRDELKPTIDKLGLNWQYNSERKEIQITADIFSDSFEEKKALMINAVDSVSELFKVLHDSGVTDANQIIANLVSYDSLNNNDIKEVLNIIKDETTRQTAGQADKNTAAVRNNQDGKQVGISDLVSLAIRRQEGEKIDSELNELFGEKVGLLRRPNASYVSHTLADKVYENLDESAYDEINDALYFDTEYTGAIDALIIRTANWLLTNGSEEDLIEAYTGNGLSEATASSIITEIKTILDNLDIC